MTKTGWIVALVVLLAIAGIGTAVYFGMKQNAAPSVDAIQTDTSVPTNTDIDSSTLDTDVDASATVDAAATTVTYTDSGFAPKQTNVAVGTTVRFVNNSTHGMWVGVNDHPSHTKYDGTSTKEHCAAGVNTNESFDSCVTVVPGTVYNYTFTKAGTFGYHNHVKSTDTGVVTVK